MRMLVRTTMALVIAGSMGCGKPNDAGAAAPEKPSSSPEQPAKASPPPASNDSAPPPSVSGTAPQDPANSANAAAAPANAAATPAGAGDSDRKAPQLAPKLKDIQVLPKSWSKKKVLAYMKKDMSKGLGVKCTFCHKKGDMAATTRKKDISRDMIEMTRRINKTDFSGKPQVSCFTCHHGNAEIKD